MFPYSSQKHLLLFLELWYTKKCTQITNPSSPDGADKIAWTDKKYLICCLLSPVCALTNWTSYLLARVSKLNITCDRGEDVEKSSLLYETKPIVAFFFFNYTAWCNHLTWNYKNSSPNLWIFYVSVNKKTKIKEIQRKIFLNLYVK